MILFDHIHSFFLAVKLASPMATLRQFAGESADWKYGRTHLQFVAIILFCMCAKFALCDR